MSLENPFQEFITETTKPAYQEGKSVILKHLQGMIPASLLEEEQDEVLQAQPSDLILGLMHEDDKSPIKYQVDGFLPVITSYVEDRVLVQRRTQLVLEYDDTEKIISNMRPHCRRAIATVLAYRHYKNASKKNRQQSLKKTENEPAESLSAQATALWEFYRRIVRNGTKQ